MRSLVGAARDEDFDDEAPPPKKRAKAKGKPRSGRGGKRRASERAVSRWTSALKSTMRSMVLWSAVLALFFVVVVVAGLFSGGHVSAALNGAKDYANTLMGSAGFKVKTVTLEGRAETAPKEIGRMLGIQAGDLMLYVDVDEARARIEALPWVKSAEVRRVWPDKIVVRIQERRPVALWQMDGAVCRASACRRQRRGDAGRRTACAYWDAAELKVACEGRRASG